MDRHVVRSSALDPHGTSDAFLAGMGVAESFGGSDPPFQDGVDVTNCSKADGG